MAEGQRKLSPPDVMLNLRNPERFLECASRAAESRATATARPQAGAPSAGHTLSQHTQGDGQSHLRPHTLRQLHLPPSGKGVPINKVHQEPMRSSLVASITADVKLSSSAELSFISALHMLHHQLHPRAHTPPPERRHGNPRRLKGESPASSAGSGAEAVFRHAFSTLICGGEQSQIEIRKKGREAIKQFISLQ